MTISLSFRRQLHDRAMRALERPPETWTAADHGAVAAQGRRDMRLSPHELQAIAEQPARPDRSAEGGISVRAAPRATTPTASVESYRSSASAEQLAASEQALRAAGIIPARK